MDFLRLHDCFREDIGRARAAITATDPAAPVPSCPGWTATDLARHLAVVYGYVAESVRTGASLGGSPDRGSSEEQDPDPIVAFDKAAAAVQEQFGARPPTDHAPTWHRPDQTVGFWVRRMAHETSIHRVDAELTAEAPVSPIPADLALDGIDEFLKIFMAYGSALRRDRLGDLLESPDQRMLLVSTEATAHEPARAWTVAAHPDGISTADARPDEPDAALTIFGRPAAVLRWLWNRPEADAVHIAGDPLLLAQFQGLRHAIEQG
jgi:uncharacterized protein (TIGR03083 family)